MKINTLGVTPWRTIGTALFPIAGDVASFKSGHQAMLDYLGFLHESHYPSHA